MYSGYLFAKYNPVFSGPRCLFTSSRNLVGMPRDGLVPPFPNFDCNRADPSRLEGGHLIFLTKKRIPSYSTRRNTSLGGSWSLAAVMTPQGRWCHSGVGCLHDNRISWRPLFAVERCWYFESTSALFFFSLPKFGRQIDTTSPVAMFSVVFGLCGDSHIPWLRPKTS